MTGENRNGLISYEIIKNHLVIDFTLRLFNFIKLLNKTTL